MPTPPAGFSISIPTGPTPDFNTIIANDPFYQQKNAWLAEDEAKARSRLTEDKALAEQLYQINRAQASASRAGGGDYGLAAATAQAGLAKETAAHDDKLREEQIREIMASRGMADSGQAPFEQQEREFGLAQMLKGIDIDLQGRASAAASARSSAQAGLAEQLQEMALRHGANMTGYERDLADLAGNTARTRGGYAFDAYGRLIGSGAMNAPSINAVWDDASGLYKASNGQYYDATGKAVSYSAPAPYQPPAAGGGAPAPYAPITDYGPPIPQLPKPGQPYIPY